LKIGLDNNRPMQGFRARAARRGVFDARIIASDPSTNLKALNEK
jgi:hypothetical protein